MCFSYHTLPVLKRKRRKWGKGKRETGEQGGMGVMVVSDQYLLGFSKHSAHAHFNASSSYPILGPSPCHSPQQHLWTIFLQAQRLHQSAPRLIPGPWPTSVEPRLHHSPRGWPHFRHAAPRSIPGGAKHPVPGVATLPCWLLVCVTCVELGTALIGARALSRASLGWALADEWARVVIVVGWLTKGCVDRFPCPLLSGRNPGSSYATPLDAALATYASPSLRGRAILRRLGGVAGRCGGG